jgi:CheY-like chemotaxis protein
MADLNGFEVLERLKKEPSTVEIPVVVVTSRVLTGPEREEIMQRAVEIVGKGNLEQTDFDEVLRRATKERIPPVIAP